MVNRIAKIGDITAISLYTVDCAVCVSKLCIHTEMDIIFFRENDDLQIDFSGNPRAPDCLPHMNISVTLA